uniref:RlpA-like protein double-psi beta-barrel domain-containing protein n=1 Tax=Oryza punctata TaxID=4537 RepID=A0A0E0M924_ORYPU
MAAASAKIVVVVAVIALLEVSSCAVARRHHRHDKPGDRGGFAAVMTVNGFRKGEDGGGPAACDGRFHGDGELIVALSTQWFAGGRRCHRRIRITPSAAHGGRRRAVEATVVDECDSRRGCKDNVVDSSPAVWRALGLDTGAGELALFAMLVLLLLASCAAARRHGKPDPCDGGGGEDSHLPPGMRRCSSPAVSEDGTPAVMTVNGFEKGEDGGGPAACDGHYHSDRSMVAALSTGWFAGGSRCHRRIRITSRQNGRSVVATVVDECDSRHGCKNNIVDTSAAVWSALGLDTNVGEVPVTWSDA